MSLVHSLLAIDSYQRYQREGGDDQQGLVGLREVAIADSGTPIGEYEILHHRTYLSLNFSATAYLNLSGEVIIAYRGTDYADAGILSSDIFTGWVTGAGVWYGEQ